MYIKLLLLLRIEKCVYIVIKVEQVYFNKNLKNCLYGAILLFKHILLTTRIPTSIQGKNKL